MSEIPMLDEFRAMGQVAERTRRVLVQRATTARLTVQQRDQLTITLTHLAAVREGFQLTLRSGSASAGEIDAIVRYTLETLDWSFLEELGLRLEQAQRLEPLGEQVVAFAHATVALAMLPRLPASEVSHPTSSHYRDLHTPRRPGEWLERIEELEATLTRLQADAYAPRRGWLPPPMLRRTHAYFDASAWLIRAHLHRFGSD